MSKSSSSSSWWLAGWTEVWYTLESLVFWALLRQLLLPCSLPLKANIKENLRNWFLTPLPLKKKFINFGGQSFFLIGGSLIALPPLLSTLLCALLFTPAGHQHSSCGCICCIFICTCICISIPVRCFPRPAGHQCSICIYICICISICICTLLSAVLFTPAGHQYSICICICITICIRTLLWGLQLINVVSITKATTQVSWFQLLDSMLSWWSSL